MASGASSALSTTAPWRALARTRIPMPAASRTLRGSRSQPCRSTTSTGSAAPSPLTRPSRTWIVRDVRRAIAGSCVTTSTEAPASALRSRSRSTTRSECTASSWPVGSSASTSFGRLIRAAQTATRCCSPPESSRGRACARDSRPDVCSTASMRRRAAASQRPSNRSGSPTISSTVRSRGSARLKFCGTRPSCSRLSPSSARAPAPAIGTPRTCRSPVDGRVRPAQAASSVDLPAPLGPRTATVSRASTVRLSPRNAATSPEGARWIT